MVVDPPVLLLEAVACPDCAPELVLPPKAM